MCTYMFIQQHSKTNYKKEPIMCYYGNKPDIRSLRRDLKMYRISLDESAIKELLNRGTHLIENTDYRIIFRLEKIDSTK